MSEENDTSASAAGPPTSPFKEDGTLVENWHTLAPEGYEDLRESKTLPRFKKFWDLSKSYEDVRRQVPLDKIPRPNDNFTDADWEEFHKAGGKPETREDYNITRPDEIPEELMPQSRIEGYQELFYKIGLSKKQCDAISEYNAQEMIASKKAMQEAEDLQNSAIETGLRKLWGLAYDQNVHRGEVAISKDKDAESDPAYKARLLDKINKDPDLIRFASNMGFKFVEHGIFEDPGIPSPADMDARIKAATDHPAYMNERHPDHARQVELVTQLIREKNKQMKKTEQFRTTL